MPEDSISINLDDLNEIMEMLPETPPQGEKRQNALTRADVMVIARIVQATGHKTCAMGFAPDEISKLKNLLGIINRGIMGIGWLIVSSIVLAIMAGAGWAIKHGIVDIAENAKKGLGK